MSLFNMKQWVFACGPIEQKSEHFDNDSVLKRLRGTLKAAKSLVEFQSLGYYNVDATCAKRDCAGINFLVDGTYHRSLHEELWD